MILWVCNGDSNASITVSAMGGLQPYDFALFADGVLIDELPEESGTNKRTFNNSIVNLGVLNASNDPIEYTWRVTDALGWVVPSILPASLTEQLHLENLLL